MVFASMDSLTQSVGETAQELYLEDTKTFSQVLLRNLLAGMAAAPPDSIIYLSPAKAKCLG